MFPAQETHYLVSPFIRAVKGRACHDIGQLTNVL